MIRQLVCGCDADDPIISTKRYLCGCAVVWTTSWSELEGEPHLHPCARHADIVPLPDLTFWRATQETT